MTATTMTTTTTTTRTTNMSTKKTLSSTTMPTMMIHNTVVTMKSATQIERRLRWRRKTQMKIFAFFVFVCSVFILLCSNFTNAHQKFELVGKVVCACAYIFSADFSFCSLSNVKDAVRLLRNVKQAEGNILHLLPFAFHAYLIKNDFLLGSFNTLNVYALIHRSALSLSFSLSTCAWHNGSKAVAISITAVNVCAPNGCWFAVKPK